MNNDGKTTELPYEKRMHDENLLFKYVWGMSKIFEFNSERQ